MAARVSRPIEVSEMVMISGEEPLNDAVEERSFGRSSYRTVSIWGRGNGRNPLASSSSIAASVSRPTGACLIVISGLDASARTSRGGREVFRAGRDAGGREVPRRLFVCLVDKTGPPASLGLLHGKSAHGELSQCRLRGRLRPFGTRKSRINETRAPPVVAPAHRFADPAIA